MHNILHNYIYTGWSNPPDIYSARFIDNDLTIKWGPPDYTGGETVNYYSVEFINELDEYVVTVV